MQGPYDNKNHFITVSKYNFLFFEPIADVVKCDETAHTSNRMFLKLWRGKVWKQEKEDIQELAAKNSPLKVFKELLRKPDGCCYYFYYFNTSFYKVLLLISCLSYFYIVFCHRICYAFVIFQKVDY